MLSTYIVCCAANIIYPTERSASITNTGYQHNQYLPMRENNQYTLYVRNAVVAIKQHLDRYPFKYKSCSELIEQTTTVNRRILEKAFKHEYGYGIKEHQIKQRMAAAKSLLSEGKPIKRIAAKCYYSSQSAFCRAFKKTYNMTPTEWMGL